MIKLKDFENYVKEQRSTSLISPAALAYKSFTDLGYDKNDEEFFTVNASHVIEALRIANWDNFRKAEEEFTKQMMKHLLESEEKISDLPGMDAVVQFIETYPDHLYRLSLSNTQSRRSRAGKEFEAIIELVLLGAGVQIDSQGKIGKDLFQNKGLGKLVDLVSPGVVEFTVDKNLTCLISAKTTLRERWQEVPEEMSRTGASKMYLATLDDAITAPTLKNIYEQNITIVTTKDIKNGKYRNDSHVITFEKLITICRNTKAEWAGHIFSAEQRADITAHLDEQCARSAAYPFIAGRYRKFKAEFEKTSQD